MTTVNSDLAQVDVELAVLLGNAIMPIHQLLRVSRGAVIELDAREIDDVIILANNKPIAKGTVIIDGSRICVNVTKMLKFVPGAKHID